MAKVEVRYRGIADRRELSAKDLKAQGVSVDRDLVWERSNGFKLVLDVDSKMEELLRNQGHFQLSEVADDDSSGSTISAAAEPESPGDTVVDESTGQKTSGRRRR